MLADDNAASSVVLGKGGLVESLLPKGAIHVSMSSISVALSKRAGTGARAGRTAIRRGAGVRPARQPRRRPSCSSSPRETRPRSRHVSPCSMPLGQKTYRDRRGAAAANLVKLSGNFLMASAIEALGEAVALIGKAGIDRRLRTWTS